MSLSVPQRPSSEPATAHPSAINDNTTDLLEEMPEWWKPPQHPFLKRLFQGLCLISVSRPSLEDHWESKRNQAAWDAHKRLVCDRLSNSNIIGGLILTASAVFLSTLPPLPSFMAYTATGPYLLTLISFAHALGSMLTGNVVVLVYESCDRMWAKNVLTADRFRLYAILVFLAWPGLSLGFSIIVLMIALLVSVFSSGLIWLQTIAVLEMLLWVWLIPAFIYCAIPKKSNQGYQPVLPLHNHPRIRAARPDQADVPVLSTRGRNSPHLSLAAALAKLLEFGVPAQQLLAGASTDG
ncbi:hypothetical protein PAXINDRAFT_18292 [Paxillus involutus ATCC 200175]|uniref:Uncharacterized protein n=1 Tax=Paxillus involutus ATCC 200175 TaxID=664439 RepID=A0A0C9TC27_PAXIN|nr:hypothetical protein PAXINDRAFT_18292 [Paxillus involutus ATCC 200175]